MRKAFKVVSTHNDGFFSIMRLELREKAMEYFIDKPVSARDGPLFLYKSKGYAFSINWMRSENVYEVDYVPWDGIVPDKMPTPRMAHCHSWGDSVPACYSMPLPDGVILAKSVTLRKKI